MRISKEALLKIILNILIIAACIRTIRSCCG